MADSAVDLPDDCWAHVFRRLGDERLLDPVSLVCRRFLAITNHLRSYLTVTDRAKLVPAASGGLPGLLHRFPNVRRIAVSGFQGGLDSLVRGIFRSGLKLEALDLTGQRQSFPRSALEDLGAGMGSSLRTLILARFVLLENDDVVAIAGAFPNLEELDISHPQQELDHSCHLRRMVTDDAIAVVSSKLRNLRSIRLSGNHFLSDNAIVSLALNCPMLAEIVAHDCTFMKGSGIAVALRQCRNLTSVSVNKISNLSRLIRGEGDLNLFLHARSLRRLGLSQMAVPDDLLASLGEMELPLMELSLSECSGLSFAGLAAALRTHGRSLHRLVLFGLEFLSDEMMVAILPHVSALNSVDLSCCYELTDVTFFSIVKFCACIEKIEMKRTSVGGGILLADLCMKNRRIRSLNLAENAYLDDHTVGRIAEVCPQLQSLDVSNCWELTGEGMGKIGELCREITELSMKGCFQIKSLGTSLGFLKLETLLAAGSGLEDKALTSIALSCKRLSKVDLGGCLGVTEKGVKEVVRECKRLQQLCMGSHNVDANVLSWIVFSRPWLRRIEWQSGPLPVKMQDFYLRHGCMVSTRI